MYSFILIILSLVFSGKSSFDEDLSNYLKINLSGKYEEYNYEILQMPKSYLKIEILNPSNFNMNGNIIYVPVKIYQNNKRVIESIISVKLKIYKNVLAASRDIKPHEILTEKDFIQKRQDVAEMNVPPVTSPSKIEGMQSSEFIKTGEIINSLNIEPIPIVKAGYPVLAKYNNGNVMINFNAISRQDGITGETITVISADKKLFKAKVVNSKEVIIVE